jgi:hypothetical protein
MARKLEKAAEDIVNKFEQDMAQVGWCVECSFRESSLTRV